MSDLGMTDPTRRTYLANDRTFLAWWRTGMAAFAVSLGAGKVVPALTHQPRWPYTVVGAGFAAMGAVLTIYGYLYYRAVGAALARGVFIEPARGVVAGLAAGGSVLGLAVGALVIWGV